MIIVLNMFQRKRCDSVLRCGRSNGVSILFCGYLVRIGYLSETETSSS